MSRTRARSKEAKKIQIEQIIEFARTLFYKEGTAGFNMRSLAKKLDMSQGNLYNYWPSKRELWFDIIKRDFYELETGMLNIIGKRKGSFLSLLVDLADYYFAFSIENPEKYKMMFVINPPDAEKIGKEERTFEPNTIAILMNVVQAAVKAGELKIIDIEKFTLYLWSIVHGAVLVATTIVFDSNSKVAVFGNVEDFLNYVKSQVVEQIRSYS